MSTDQTIEQEIQAKGLTAPRVTPPDVEAEIVSEDYFVAGDGVCGAAHKAGDHEVQSFPQALDLLTFCVLRLRNGFTVTGESACVSAKNFDAEVGRSTAREKAVDKVWQFLGFRLADAVSGKGLLYPQSVAFRARLKEPSDHHRWGRCRFGVAENLTGYRGSGSTCRRRNGVVFSQ